MSENDIDVKIGQAWKAHYKGDQTTAIEQFKELVAQAPDNIDALWGLGLSYRKAGDLENARQVFTRAKELVQEEQEKMPGELGRLPMLSRMIDQQLEFISDFMQ